MLKIMAIVSLVLIATWSHAASRRHKKDSSAAHVFDTGNTMWASSLSCDSCGSECMSACGTRHFRSCCFNYLRKKRGPDAVKLWTPTAQDSAIKENLQEKLPFYVVKNIPEPWFGSLMPSDLKPYPFEDTVENRLQIAYDA